MRAAAISESQARRSAWLLRPVARDDDADDHLLAFLELTLGHRGVGAVADAELQRDRGRLAVGPDHPHAPGGRPARAPGLPSRAAGSGAPRSGPGAHPPSAR